MPVGDPVVYVIDDEPSVQRALLRMLRAAGLSGVAFSSVDDFESSGPSDANACVVTDVHMPGRDPIDLPDWLAQQGLSLPVIYITGRDSDKMRRAVRRAGAAAYFRKPIDDQALIDTIHWVTGDRRNTN